MLCNAMTIFLIQDINLHYLIFNLGHLISRTSLLTKTKNILFFYIKYKCYLIRIIINHCFYP